MSGYEHMDPMPGRVWTALAWVWVWLDDLLRQPHRHQAQP